MTSFYPTFVLYDLKLALSIAYPRPPLLPRLTRLAWLAWLARPARLISLPVNSTNKTNLIPKKPILIMVLS